jgi:hypothetical protein
MRWRAACEGAGGNVHGLAGNYCAYPAGGGGLDECQSGCEGGPHCECHVCDGILEKKQEYMNRDDSFQ